MPLMCLQLPDNGPVWDLDPGFYQDPGLYDGRITTIPLPEIQLGPVVPTEKHEFRILTIDGIIWHVAATHYTGPGQPVGFGSGWFVFFDGLLPVHQIVSGDVKQIWVSSGEEDEDINILRNLGILWDDEDDLDLEADSQAARNGDPVIVVKEPSNTKLDRKKNA